MNKTFNKTTRKNSRKNSIKVNGPSNRLRNSSVARIERMDHPRQIDAYEVAQMRLLRFTVTAATGNFVITYQNLLDSILIATTAIQGFNLFDLVRIVKVEVWSQAAIGTPTTVGVTFVTTTGDRAIHTDTSLGVKPAHVLAHPSPLSLASFFQLSGGGNAFIIQAPGGSIVDVSVELRTINSLPIVAQNALVGATVGDIYYRGLDGLASAGTNFPPILGVNTI